MFGPYCSLVFMDDKHRSKVGEHGLPVAAMEREKKVIATTSGKKFTVADHDFTRFLIIPSVTMICDIPETIGGSFYRGQVLIDLKDAAPVHSVTVQSYLRLCWNETFRAHFYQRTRSQCNVFECAAIGLIIIVFMLEAMHTAPCQSWKNPCERV